ncbi:hypothetical protein ACFY2K_26850 [Kitasatospora sp. NPDC001309]|uniref:hypothetical protein n=1 Tax=Kitasatospora sp. NPDC001309 TaxID=3364013 RepID=UPI0036C79EF5
MTGTVVVHAESPLVALVKGSYGVVIDGVRVGRVRQGAVARFPVPAGTHAVGLTVWDGTRSNAVTVEVGEDREFLLSGRGTGLGYAFLLPVLARTVLPWYYTVVALLLMLAAVRAVPGLTLRLRAVGDSYLPAVHGDERAGSAGPAEGESAEGEGAGNGLWWESDPALAKRLRKSAGS